MDVRFAIAFGGPILFALIGYAVVIWLDPRKSSSAAPATPNDVDAGLAEIQAALHRAEAEIARVRALLALQKAS
jgi:hypothetical protein